MTGYALGIPVASFTLRYRYEASGTRVMKKLDCSGWFSGWGVSDSVKITSYVMGSGRGFCEAQHSISLVMKGFPISFTKLHSITTNSGVPSKYVATLRNG